MNIQKPKDKDHYYYYHYEFFNNYFDIVWAFIEKDYETEMHQQEFYEINIITKGEGIHFIENNNIPATLGSVFIIPPNVTHGYIGGGGFDVFHILISDKFIQKFICDLQQFPSFFILFNAEPLMRSSSSQPLHLSLTNEQFNKISEILNKLIEYDDHDNAAKSIIRSNYTMILITYLCEIYSSNNYLDNYSNSDKAFMRAISLIHERYNKKITIDELSKISKLSRSAFIKKFKKICKMPPSSYLIKIRIEAAKNMLKTTQYTINEVAERTGFYDTPHFSRCFEKLVGTTPANYRNNI